CKIDITLRPGILPEHHLPALHACGPLPHHARAPHRKLRRLQKCFLLPEVRPRFLNRRVRCRRVPGNPRFVRRVKGLAVYWGTLVCHERAAFWEQIFFWLFWPALSSWLFF